MRHRKHKGPFGLEGQFGEADPALGRHILDARIIRTFNPQNELDRDEIEAAKARSEERRTYWGDCPGN